MWKDIIGFEGLYKIDEYGNVYSLLSNKILNTYVNNKGYKCIDLKKDGTKYKFLVHRLVAMCFVPNPDPVKNTIVLHNDNNKTNTYYENLHWGTYSENNAQAIHDKLNKVPKPDNRIYYEIYDPANPEVRVKVFRGLGELKDENGVGGTDSMYRNFIYRDSPITKGKYAGYKIRKSDVICPIKFKEFY